MGSVFDSLFAEGAPLLEEAFGTEASVVYTSASGTASSAVTAILGSIREARAANEAGSIIERTRTVKIRRTLLADVQKNGTLTIDSIDWNILSEPIRTPTWWEFEIVSGDYLEFRAQGLRQL